jgi:hypothetical protein
MLNALLAKTFGVEISLHSFPRDPPILLFLTILDPYSPNATLTLRIARRAFLIMGDKSPKANQKHKAQQKAKTNSAAQKKEQQASAAKAAPRKK